MEKITIDTNVQTSLVSSLKRVQAPEKNNSFGGVLKSALNKVNQVQKEADQAIHELAAGDEKDIHQTMIAIEKAEVSFQLMMQVRNKIIAAYETIMRMQV